LREWAGYGCGFGDGVTSVNKPIRITDLKHGSSNVIILTVALTGKAEERLTLAAYSAGPVKRAYVEPMAVGRELIDMPLFLTPDVYVNVPLETTYRAAYRGVPRRWRDVLDAPPCA
jgi:hypothetical protein